MPSERDIDACMKATGYGRMQAINHLRGRVAVKAATASKRQAEIQAACQRINARSAESRAWFDARVREAEARGESVWGPNWNDRPRFTGIRLTQAEIEAGK